MYQCDECIKTGSSWLHLRTCQTCGATLCCDSSPNKHASKHAETENHPVASSTEPNERWLWCYQHKSIKKY
ncbi:UBP-type zinc finger domain-containing protein [Winogradskyella luteola]|uniref:UBP-type zinc finger domain-containing protein n=1 Tax=Winogradskyella luteola TaxID=2828330 RepID=UPI003F74CABE